MKKRIISALLIAALIITIAPVLSFSASASQQDDMVSAALAHVGKNYSFLPNCTFDWCAYFTTYVADEIGICGTADNPTGSIFPPAASDTHKKLGWIATSVTRQIGWFTSNGHGTLYYFTLAANMSTNSSTVKADRKTFTPLPGDLIYLNTTKNRNCYSHVAIVYDYDPGNGRVYYVGGNQGNRNWAYSKVSCREISMDSENLLAFLRPNYHTEYSYPPCKMADNCPSAAFVDVNTARWYHDSLDFAVEQGLIRGTDSTHFSPYRTMTRGMMITVLYRLAGSPDASNLKNPFKDINDKTWCADAVKWAYANKVAEGYENGRFGSELEISRAQAAKMLYGYAKLNGLDCSKYRSFDGFEDAKDVGAWAADSMHWALGTGIIKGNSATTINPDGRATRCQLAAIFARYMQYYGLNTHEEAPEETEAPQPTPVLAPIPEPSEAPVSAETEAIVNSAELPVEPK